MYGGCLLCTLYPLLVYISVKPIVENTLVTYRAFLFQIFLYLLSLVRIKSVLIMFRCQIMFTRALSHICRHFSLLNNSFSSQRNLYMPRCFKKSPAFTVSYLVWLLNKKRKHVSPSKYSTNKASRSRSESS